MKQILKIFVITFLFVIPITYAQNQSSGHPLGFLALRSQSPLQQVRFGMQHHVPWVSPGGTYKVYFEHNWKNVWMYKKQFYRIDAEIHELSVRTCIGVGHRLELSMELPFRYVSGGVLDNLIEGFHRTFGLGNQGRNEYPQNQFAFEINPEGTENGWEYAGKEQLGWHLGNIIVAGSYSLFSDRNRKTGVTVTTNVKLPTGTRNEFFGGQSVDVGLSVSWYKGMGQLYWYVSPGIVYYGDGEMIGVVLRQWHFSGLAAVEYHADNSRHSWILQLLMESGIAKEFSQFTNNTYELIFAYKRRLSPSLVFEVGFLENLFFYDNSPDIGLHLGIVKMFGGK